MFKIRARWLSPLIPLAAMAAIALPGVQASAGGSPPFGLPEQHIPIWGGPLTSGNQTFIGHTAIADAGPAREITTAGFNVTAPHLDCADTVVGSSGIAQMTPWVGISNNINGGFLAQTGFYTWCTGPPGQLATGGPFYTAWYVVCCNNSLPIEFYQGTHPTISSGDLLGFEAARNNTNGSWNFTFINHTKNQTFHTNLPCPTRYLNCSFDPTGNPPIRSVAWAITEALGGPPVTPLPYWDCGTGNCNPASTTLNFTGAFLRSYDGSQGSWGNKANEWSGPNDESQSFPGAARPYAIGGYLDTSTGLFHQGNPQPMTLGDTAFSNTCLEVLDSNPQDDFFCP